MGADCNGNPRLNFENRASEKVFNPGGVLLAIFKTNEKLKFKLGVYESNEFFDPLIMPMAGIEWKVNERNNLFSVLPGRLSFEHKLNQTFYAGATFRAITNSYRLTNGNYLRIVDNQLSAFLDHYAVRRLGFSA